MDSKKHNETREYVRGYEDAKDGKPSNDGSDAGTALITLGFFGGPRPEADSYRQGYHDGKEDRRR